MQRKIIEQVTLLVSVIKWTCYASVVGVLVGFGTAAFLRSLAWTSSQFSRIPDFYLLLPLTLAACSILVSWLGRLSQKPYSAADYWWSSAREYQHATLDWDSTQ